MKTLKTKDEFEDTKTGYPGLLIVVKFYADWCGYCRIVAPIYKEVAEKYQGVIFCEVNVDANKETAEMCGIKGMPTFQFFRDGEKVDEVVGTSKEALEKAIEKNQK